MPGIKPPDRSLYWAFRVVAAPRHASLALPLFGEDLLAGPVPCDRKIADAI